MKIIISPTKQMTNEQDFFFPESQPIFSKETQQLLNTLKKLTIKEAQQLWKCNDKLAHENYERIQYGQLSKQTSPAIMSYKGLQYQYMAPDIFTQPALAYLQEHVRILSGFYGVLRPFDGIIPYRLEMQAPLKIKSYKNLYQFWHQKIYKALEFDQQPVINLASKEYSKAIIPFLKETDRMIDILFYHEIDGKLKVKATLAKMARGEMIRYLAENQIETIEGIKEFDHPHYQFSTQYSTDKAFIFIYKD